MAGGLGKVHRGHFNSLRRASDVIANKFRGVIFKSNQIYQDLPLVKIDICSESCPMFINDKCDSLGVRAPLGKNCKAQEISQGVER